MSALPLFLQENPDHAIVMRRVEYGDYDLILTLFSKKEGKISLLAKNARKSKKRFTGRIENFSLIAPETSRGKNGGMPFLQGAFLLEPFEGLRLDFLRMGYAAYWMETLCLWLEEKVPQPAVHELVLDFLRELNAGETSPEFLSLVYHLRFLSIAGLAPGLDFCGACGKILGEDASGTIRFDLGRGRVLCPQCQPSSRVQSMSLGTLKALSWVQYRDRDAAGRIQFSGQSRMEGLDFLENFMGFHLGREFRSLRYLRNVRKGRPHAAP
ncbi:DNA repair protein RecO [Desulfococcaceae bacterium OttesenSCG-928-F15]|nr:DNA repair protein RecO [Desulfococcaceae bacterium OttesenSCG-928-F15]